MEWAKVARESMEANVLCLADAEELLEEISEYRIPRIVRDAYHAHRDVKEVYAVKERAVELLKQMRLVGVKDAKHAARNEDARRRLRELWPVHWVTDNGGEVDRFRMCRTSDEDRLFRGAGGDRDPGLVRRVGQRMSGSDVLGAVQAARDCGISVEARDVVPKVGYVHGPPDGNGLGVEPADPHGLAVTMLDDWELSDKVAQGLEFLQSRKFWSCPQCEGRMMVTPQEDEFPGWATETRGQDSLWRRVGWRTIVTKGSGAEVCPVCISERAKSANKLATYVPPDFGLDFTCLDALTDFEEMLLTPIHCVVHVYVVWTTGALKYRNMTYGVEQDVGRWFSKLPIDPKDAPVLKIARGNLSWKAPFVASHRKLKMGWYHCAYGRAEAIDDEEPVAATETRVRVERYLGRGPFNTFWDQYKSESETDCSEMVPCKRSEHETTKNLLIGRDIVNRWLGGTDGGQAGVSGLGRGVSSVWAAYRKQVHSVAARDGEGDARRKERMEDFDVARQCVARNIKVELELLQQTDVDTTDAVVVNSVREVRQAEQFALGFFACRLAEMLADVDEEDLVTECVGVIASMAAEEAPVGQVAEAPVVADGRLDAAASMEDAVKCVKETQRAFDGRSVEEDTAAEQKEAATRALEALRRITVVKEPQHGTAVLEDTPYMVANMFLKVFPCMQGDVTEYMEKYPQGAFEDWFWTVLVRSGGRAMKHQRFLFAMLDRLWRDMAKKGRKRFWKGNKFSEKDMREKMKTEEGIKELVSSLNSSSFALPGTKKKKDADLHDLEAMIEQCDDEGEKLALFVTHTCPVELHDTLGKWNREFAAGCPVKTHDKEAEHLAADEDDLKSRCALAVLNPFTSAMYSELRLSLTLDLVIEVIKKRMGLPPEYKLNYWVTPEWGSETGMRHDHCVFFLPGCPDLSFSEEELLSDVAGDLVGVPNLSDVNCKMVGEFYAPLISECNLLKPPSSEATEASHYGLGRRKLAAAQGRARPVSAFARSTEAVTSELRSRDPVSADMVRKHVGECVDERMHDFHGNAGKGMCKVGAVCYREKNGVAFCSGRYPRAPVCFGSEAVVTDEIRADTYPLHLMRNCAFVPPFIPLAVIMCGGSVDAQATVRSGGVSAYMNKVGRYMTKPRGKACNGRGFGASLFKECIRRSQSGSFGDVAIKFLNRAQTPGEIYAVEVAHHMLGFVPRKCSKPFVGLYLDGGSARALEPSELEREFRRAKAAGAKDPKVKAKTELERYETRCACVNEDCVFPCTLGNEFYERDLRAGRIAEREDKTWTYRNREIVIWRQRESYPCPVEKCSRFELRKWWGGKRQHVECDVLVL